MTVAALSARRPWSKVNEYVNDENVDDSTRAWLMVGRCRLTLSSPR